MPLLVPPPLQGLIIAALMWAVSRYGPDLAFAVPGQGLAAIAFAAVGLAIELIATGAFIRAKTTVNPLRPSKADKLVVAGLYKFSRNPMYLGLLLLLIGWATYLASPLNLLLLAAFVWYITMFQIKPEEAALTEKFGEDYLAYKRRVRRWI